jgi:cysteinyl-tRNA synthetase
MHQTHYRSPLDFSEEAVGEAERSIGRLYETLARCGVAGAGAGAGKARAAGRVDEANACREHVRSALADDLNAPRALAALYDAVRAANRLLDAGHAAEAREVAEALREGAGVLGILQADPEATLAAWRDRRAAAAGLSEDEVGRRIDARNEARRARDFKTADRIRAELTEAGIDLKDHPDGTTTWAARR